VRIFTVGHGAADFATVSRILEAHGVATIADVRSQPWSRRAPDFNRRRLEALAAGAGFGYRWLGDALGGRPTDPALLDAGGAPDPAAMRAAPAFRAGLAVIEELSGGGGVVLLCAEADPAHCHRATLLAPPLVERGTEVIHLLHDGTARPHQPTLSL
jgi:uncharacterized protein (DUF488 family)